MKEISKEIAALREPLLRDLEELVAIPSVMEREQACANAPFGPGVRRAFDCFLQLAQEKGFAVRDWNGYALDAQIGTGDAYIGVLGHLDVVEARHQPEWESDPFCLREKEGMLYGRGVNDDKGPLLAALYAAWLIKEQGWKLKYPIRIIAGGAEETTWECMEHYFQHNAQPLYGFSPDGNFPIVNGEKGILQVRFVFPPCQARIQSAPRLNFVCGDLRVELKTDEEAVFAKAQSQIRQGDRLLLQYRGKSALSRNPQRGDNAIFHFAHDFAGKKWNDASLEALVRLLDEQFCDDHYGKKSGLFAEDANMGTTSVCPMSVNSGEQLELCVDIRYVRSVSEQTLLTRLEQIAARYQAKMESIKEKRLLYVAEETPLIQALKHAYEHVTGEKAQVLTKGGASYARVLERGVAFGATFEGEDPRPHMANERMPIASLLRACEIYYEALKELAVEG